MPADGTLTITFIADIADTVGAGTYQDFVSGISPSTYVLSFDSLATTDEDVTVEWPTATPTDTPI
jgi:hypothetical protein